MRSKRRIIPQALVPLTTVVALTPSAFGIESETPVYNHTRTICEPGMQFRDQDTRLGTDSKETVIGAWVLNTIGHPSILGTKPTIKTATVSSPATYEIFDRTKTSPDDPSDIWKVEARSYLAFYPKNKGPEDGVQPTCVPSKSNSVVMRGNPRWSGNKISLVSPRPSFKCRLNTRDVYRMVSVSFALIYVISDPTNPFRFLLHGNDEGVVRTYCRPMLSRLELLRIKDDKAGKLPRRIQ